MNDAKYLPDTGRGTIRRMVEGLLSVSSAGAVARYPSTKLRAVPLPVPGRY